MSDQSNAGGGATKPPIEEVLPFAQALISRRRHKWKLSTMGWEDVAQIILIRVWQQYPKFDPAKGPFENWCNRLISHAFINVLRDSHLKWEKPCVSRGMCAYNRGGDSCGFTPSGKQCAECPLYARWQDKKQGQYNIKATLGLDAHPQEVHNTQSDTFDVEAAKTRIDAIMLKRLNPFDRRIYRLLLIKHLTPMETSIELKRKLKKRKLKEGEGCGYQSVLATLTTFKAMIKQIIDEESFSVWSTHPYRTHGLRNP